MGYNASVVVLLDRLDEIEKDPDFGKKLAAAIRHKACYRDHPKAPLSPYVTGQTYVVDVQHADVMQVVAVGANAGRTIGYSHWRSDDDGIVKALNDERLARQRAAKKAKDLEPV